MYASLGSLGLHQVWANGQNAYYMQRPIFTGKSVLGSSPSLSLINLSSISSSASSSCEEEPKADSPRDTSPATFLYAARINRKPDYGWFRVTRKKRSYKFVRNTFEFLLHISDKVQEDILARWDLWMGKYELPNGGEWLKDFFRSSQLQILHVDSFHREWILHLPSGETLAGASHDHDFLEYMGRPFHAVACVGFAEPAVWSPRTLAQFDSSTVLYVGQCLAVGIELFPHVLDELWHEIFGFAVDSFVQIKDLNDHDDCRTFGLYHENVFYSSKFQESDINEKEYTQIGNLFMVIGNQIRSSSYTVLDDYCQSKEKEAAELAENGRNSESRSILQKLFRK